MENAIKLLIINCLLLEREKKKLINCLHYETFFKVMVASKVQNIAEHVAIGNLSLLLQAICVMGYNLEK